MLRFKPYLHALGAYIGFCNNCALKDYLIDVCEEFFLSSCLSTILYSPVINRKLAKEKRHIKRFNYQSEFIAILEYCLYTREEPVSSRCLIQYEGNLSSVFIKVSNACVWLTNLGIEITGPIDNLEGLYTVFVQPFCSGCKGKFIYPTNSDQPSYEHGFANESV